MLEPVSRPRSRRRTRTGLPVHGGLPPREPRVVRRRHTRAWIALAALLLTMVGGTVIWKLQHSSYFLVNQVQVSGTRLLDRQSVVQAAGVLGKQMYWVDSATVQQAVQRLPLVRSATVRKVWPHTVQIAVQERQPWGTWQLGGADYLVDQQGMVLNIVNQPSPRTISEIDAAPGLQPGDRVNANAIKAATELMQELPAFVSQQVGKVEYSSDGGLELITNTGVQARIGDSTGIKYKLAVWQSIAAKVGSKNIHLIDLRFGDRPYYR